MSCSHGSDKPTMVPKVVESKDIVELVKAGSIDEANKLLQEGYIFFAVYYNQSLGHEEYVFGKPRSEKETSRPIGFIK